MSKTKWIVMAAGCMLGLQTVAHATQIGVQGTVGLSSIGLFRYEETFGVGVYAGRTQNNATAKTELTTLGFWAELRQAVSPDLYFCYGLSGWMNGGTNAGNAIESDYAIAPFVQVEYFLTPKLFLSVWNNVVQYESTKSAGVTVNTTSFFQTSLGVNYLF